MNVKKTLLEKYSIPIENLDFDYIKNTKNVRELEKMVEILRSGEEGYYPDLTKSAENKLSELDPNNRMLRTEVQCMRTSYQEKQEINEFTENIKSKDKTIRNQSNPIEITLPPIRKQSETSKIDENSASVTQKRIATCDYAQWDRFDADTECLKIDLNEERMCERALVEQKRQEKPKLIEILPEKNALDQISDIEKQDLAEKHRIKGNEFFKCSEFPQAISEYTTSLTYAKTAAAFNNRALVYLKQKMYDKAIRDCDDCLQLDGRNVKAMLRKCDALIASDRKNDAYKQYTCILDIDPENEVAKKALENISLRLEIQDVNVQPQVRKTSKSQYLEFDENNEDFQKKLIIPIHT